MTPFRDRRDAGRQLATHIQIEQFRRPLVLALPRGGVPVAFEVAQALRAPLDAFVARKLAAPGHPELGIGAIAEGSDNFVVSATARDFGVTRDELVIQATREQRELARRVARYRGGRRLPDMAGRDVIVVDDGLATGVTAEAALRALRTRNPARLLLAVAVCAADAGRRLTGVADSVLCVLAPPNLRAVGLWYEDFEPTSDAEVIQLLDQARTPRTGVPPRVR
ncbi:MAG TPA: phosphoribosyltransferase family protein [Acidimicrobiia bacterium]